MSDSNPEDRSPRKTRGQDIVGLVCCGIGGLFAVSIAPLGEPSLELSPEIAAVVPRIVAAVLDEASHE